MNKYTTFLKNFLKLHNMQHAPMKSHGFMQ
nr:MAG TPA: hypothetical protein [Caudoviricetes sp.]